LTVNTFLQEGVDEKEQRVSETEMKKLNLERYAVCPKWNYIIRLVGRFHFAFEPVLRRGR